MEYKEVYEEYKADHPEEMEGVNALFVLSEKVELDRERRRKAKLAEVAKWKEILNAESA